MLTTSTLAGLHTFLLGEVVPRVAQPRDRAVDLGAGTGALAVRLHQMGLDVLAVDRDAGNYRAGLPFVQVDLDQDDFASQLGARSFNLVTAVEVIEHLESPIGFLRNVARLLKPDGVAIVTTPNVDNVPARFRFLLAGHIRMMDARSEPTHISPIFSDLLLAKFLPRVGLQLTEWRHYPPKGYALTRPLYAYLLRLAALFLGGRSLLGDSHVLLLRLPRE